MQIHTGGVVGSAHDAGDLLELAAPPMDWAACTPLMVRAAKRKVSMAEQAHQNGGVSDGEISVSTLTFTTSIADQQGQGGEAAEPMPCRWRWCCPGVRASVRCAPPRQAAHLGDAAGVVGHGAVGVGGQDARVGMPTAAMPMPYRPWKSSP